MLDFVDDVGGRAAAMRVTEDRVAAPGARVWAPSSSDQRNRPFAVVLAPYVDVAGLIDRRAIGERLGVQVGNHRPRLVSHDGAARAAVRDAFDAGEILFGQ